MRPSDIIRLICDTVILVTLAACAIVQSYRVADLQKQVEHLKEYIQDNELPTPAWPIQIEIRRK